MSTDSNADTIEGDSDTTELDELRAEVTALRKQVAQLSHGEDSDSSDGLSRRDFLAGAATVGAAGVVGAGASSSVDRASAESTAAAATTGQVGTASSPVDVFAGSVDADSATINTTLTDAAGVSHTGELADDGDAQPPEDHDNSAHSETFVSDGDGTTRQIWVIANGASDPAGAGPEDIIFEEEA